MKNMKLPDYKSIKINKRNIIVILALLVFILVAVLVVRNSEGALKGKRYTASFYSMDTFMSVTCYGKYGKDAVKDVKKEVVSLGKKMAGSTSESVITKGYAADKAIEIIKENGVKSALLSFGDDVICHGKKPDGKLWRVGVKSYSKSGSEMVGVMELCDRCIFTAMKKESSTEDEKAEMLSVTVVSPYGALADSLASDFFKMDREAVFEYWKENGSNAGSEFEIIYVTDMKIYVTEGLWESFSSEEETELIHK